MAPAPGETHATITPATNDEPATTVRRAIRIPLHQHVACPPAVHQTPFGLVVLEPPYIGDWIRKAAEGDPAMRQSRKISDVAESLLSTIDLLGSAGEDK